MKDHPQTDTAVGALVQALLEVDRVTVGELLSQGGQGDTPISLMESLVVPALEQIGQGWEQGTVSLAQVYMSGRICEEKLDALLPDDCGARRDQPPMAVAVLEDQHRLGLRIVYSVLRSAGFALHNYGCMPLDPLLERVREDGVRILLVSTLMLPAALRILDLVASLQTLDPPPKVVVGGAPFRFAPSLWERVGADAYGETATDAVAIVNRLVEGMK